MDPQICSRPLRERSLCEDTVARLCSVRLVMAPGEGLTRTRAGNLQGPFVIVTFCQRFSRRISGALCLVMHTTGQLAPLQSQHDHLEPYKFACLHMADKRIRRANGSVLMSSGADCDAGVTAQAHGNVLQVDLASGRC